VLCLGPGPSSLLHLTRANAEKPYAGDTPLVSKHETKSEDNLQKLIYNYNISQI
jgi:hypothetical protein